MDRRSFLKAAPAVPTFGFATLMASGAEAVETPIATLFALWEDLVDQINDVSIDMSEDRFNELSDLAYRMQIQIAIEPSVDHHDTLRKLIACSEYGRGDVRDIPGGEAVWQEARDLARAA